MTRNEKRLLVATAKAVRDIGAAVDVGTSHLADLAQALAPFDAEAAMKSRIRTSPRLRNGRSRKDV